MKNLLGRQALIQAEQEAFNITENIFETLTNKDKLQFNEAFKSLQYCKLNRHNSENVEEWMKRCRIAAKECNYQESDRWVKEECINGINDDNMLIEIVTELKAMKKTRKITSNQILMWAK